jgi:hypothetical protein
MSEFTIRTVDNEYYYDSQCAVGVVFEPLANIKTGDTQGFLRKVNKGKLRHNVKVVMPVSESTYNDILLPMIEYVDDVYCTFDRLIPMRGVNTGTFTFENLKLIQEFPQNGDGLDFEVELSLVEVLSN